uniref:Ovule protein n=1 Tax=Heterorhabditis bacteriophora TaxID=37862 RepID=A0A1I7WJN0_HETBA
MYLYLNEHRSLQRSKISCGNLSSYLPPYILPLDRIHAMGSLFYEHRVLAIQFTSVVDAPSIEMLYRSTIHCFECSAPLVFGFQLLRTLEVLAYLTTLALGQEII